MSTGLLSIQETAHRLGLSRPTVREMIDLGQLRAVEAGKLRRIPAWQVENLLNGHPIADGPAECVGCSAASATA